VSGEGRRAAVLAVDGGNSKAELALVGADGELHAAVRGGTISHQQVGLEAGMARLERLAAGAREQADASARDPLAEVGVYCLAGADFEPDVEALRGGIERAGLTGSTSVLNDTFAGLRAGTTRPWGVVLICGQGVNGAAVAPDGRMARFAGMGDISGDWGGGGGIGMAALGAAVRAEDGRGPRTILERLVPEFYGVARPADVTKGLYLGSLEPGRLSSLTPSVFEAAEHGDAVARGIVDRLADELVAMATALIRRLDLAALDPEIVLAGGVFQAHDPLLYERLEAGIRTVAPAAALVRLTAPPVVGAALIGLDRVHGGTTPPEAEARLRGALTRERLTAGIMVG
jgi:N-acetylglucosamine kinase-like BadF-type ATPase